MSRKTEKGSPDESFADIISILRILKKASVRTQFGILAV